MRVSIKYLFGMLMVLASMSVFAIPTIATWSFNLPSTSTSGQNPPYPLVATLTLTQVGSDVQFVLDPNEISPGVSDPMTSFVKQIDFVISNRVLTDTDYANIINSSLSSQAPILSVRYDTDKTNMDSGYETQDQHVIINFWEKRSPSQFGFNDTSSWTIAGVTLADFTSTYATSNSHPSPTFGVISVAPYSLGGEKVCGPTLTENCNGTSSNWVTGPVAVVPEPEIYAMLLAGLGLVGFSARRKMKNI